MPISEDQGFYGDIDANKPIISIEKIKSLSDRIQQSVVDRFDEFKFVIRRFGNAAGSRARVCPFKSRLGEPAPHARADTVRILSIDPVNQAVGSLRRNRSEHFIHTDEACSNQSRQTFTVQGIFAATFGRTTMSFAAVCWVSESTNPQTRRRLGHQDISIADNTAIVHGRTAFPSDEKRTMRRLNFDASGPLCANLSLGFVAP